MPANWFRYRTIYMKVRYVEWRGGRAFFRRRIPRDLKKYYPGKRGEVFFSLRTRDPVVAAKKADLEAQRLDAEWARLRSGDGTTAEVRTEALALLRKHGLEPGQWAEWQKHDLEPDSFIQELEAMSGVDGVEVLKIEPARLPPAHALAANLFFTDPEEAAKLIVPLLSEVKLKHLEFHPGKVDDKQFHAALDQFIALNGDLPVNHYRRQHGNNYVRALLDAGRKAATVKRYLAQVRPVFKTAIVELEIGMTNPLSDIRIPAGPEHDEKARAPFTMTQLRAIQARCREVDDERRWLIALLSDTGCRLAEAAGLLRKEVRLDTGIPHLVIQPNKLRRLKNAASRRLVPLVGEALWAAERAMEGNASDYLFPGLVRDGELNAASVSAALNAWLTKNQLRNADQPLHSFRHSFRDRLRNAGVPSDVQDRLGGWTTGGVGESYGQGHSLEVLHRHMLAALEPERSAA